MKKKSLVIKIVAILLIAVLVMALLPATLFASAETPNVKPFYLVNWDRDFANGTYSNLYGMPYTWTKIYAEGTNASKTDYYYPGEDGSLGYIDIGVYFNGKSSNNIKTAAKWLKEEFDKMPEGSRYLNLAAMGTVFNAFVQDAIDFEDGITLMADWLDRFLTEYKSIGGKLDGIATDLEYNKYTSFYLESYFCNALTVSKNAETGVYEMIEGPRNLDILQDIVRNERVYQEKIRPQLKELEAQGKFEFYTAGINPETGLPDNLATAKGPNTISSGGKRLPIPVSEISTINRYSESGGISSCASMWNAVLLRHLIDCINRAAYYPMLEHYPDANLSDYSHANTYSWHKGFATDGGGTGTGVMAGNTTNKVYYGSSFSEYYYNTSSNSSTKQMYFKPAGMNGAVYDETDPYYRAIMDINNQKNALYSTMEYDPDAKVSVWVPYYNYSSNTKSYGDSPYFTEVMYHLGLTDPEPFLGYIIKSEVENKGKGSAFSHDPNYASFPFALQVSNEILAELTRVAGASDRKPIVTPVTWDDGFVYSGMYAGGRNLWRITPDNNKISVDNFKVAGTKAPTFSVNGVTITFPQGRIIADTDITHIGSYGYWIETPADVYPVITKNANYFVENPAFGETFDKYLEGAFKGSASSIDKTLFAGGYRPDTYWLLSGNTITLDDEDKTVQTIGSAEIINQNGNKALTLTGTATITNSANKVSSKPSNTIPALITAGDYFAQQQAWEVTVTLPASSTYTSISLLGFDDGDKYTSDAVKGFVLSSGKVQYYQNSTQKTLSNVDLTTGGTYRFKRELDFTNKTSSYYIYNASGTLLASATNVAMSSGGVTLPVSKISMSASNANNAVILDDYKLYPIGVTTNLDLYETTPLSYFSNLNSLVSKVSDTTAARTEKTFYRVSWLNNSGVYKYAVLKNSKTGAVIEKVLMAPGDSGYFTGSVEASASSPVVFALTQESATAPSTPDYENGDFTWDGYAENMGITCYVIDQGYAKLEDALAAAKDGQTVNMIADAEMSATAVIDSSVKINTNGHKITVADNFDGDAAITLVAGGNLTWSDGMAIDAGAKTAICVTGGTLNVTGGTITSTGTAIMTEQDADKTAITVNITGGRVQGAKAFLHTGVTTNANISILASAVNGTVVSEELHYEMQNNNGTYTLHSHTVVIDAAQAPTCTDTGLTQGYHYPCCNKVGLAQEVVDALDHDWKDAVICGATKSCTRCGITDGDPKDHEFGAPVVTPPTCTEGGYTSETCSICSYQKVYDKTPAAHKPGDIQIENIVPASCTESGTKDEVRYCTVCNVETSRNTVTTDAATGHTDGAVVTENNVQPTCTEDGSYDNVTYCTVCSAETSRATVTVDATGHTDSEIEVENEVIVTCTEDGSYDNVKYCIICLSETFRETITIPAPGHTDGEVEVENEIDKTCTEDGSYDNVIYCTTCSEETFRETIIVPATGHNQLGSRVETISELTCTTPESYDTVVYCTVCGYEHSRKNTFTAAPGHKFVVGATNVTCENCDYDEVIGTASLTINTGTNPTWQYWTPQISIGMTPAYAKTTSDGLITTDGASAGDWNLKVEWNIGGKPTLTLKEATLRNSNVKTSSETDAHSTVRHTINIGGSADFVIALQGTNTLTDCWDVGGTAQASERNCGSIYATNTGTLTIKGNSQADSLKIDNAGGNCITKKYNALTIEDISLSLILNKTYQGQQTGIVLEYVTEGLENLTNLTVRNSDFDINYTSDYHSVTAIVLTSTENALAPYKTNAYVDLNKGDLLFENSDVYIRVSFYTGQKKDGYEIVNFGAYSTCTFRNSDAYIYGRHLPLSYVPTIENATGTIKGTAFPSETYPTGSSLVGVLTSSTAVDITHTCTAGEPVIEKKYGECDTYYDSVTYCSRFFCGKELNRETIEITDPAKVHTPGSKVEVSRVPATSTTEGKYVFEVTCAICGETYPEEQTFGIGVFYWSDTGTDGRISLTSTTTPKLKMQPGDTYYYITEIIGGDAKPNTTKFTKVTADDQWTIKFDYPDYGHPIMTLRGAVIHNAVGLFYGVGANTSTAPLTIYVESDSEIIGNSSYGSYSHAHCSLRFETTSDVTITGPGKLTIRGQKETLDPTAHSGEIYTEGNLIFDHANVDITFADNDWKGSQLGNGIVAKGSDIIIKGGNLTIMGYDMESSSPQKSAISSVLYATKSTDGTGGNIIVQDGANVKIVASPYNSDTSVKAIMTEGSFVIKDSTVEMAAVKQYWRTLFSATSKPVLNFTNSDYTLVASTKEAGFDAATELLTAPTSGIIENYTTNTGASIIYFKVAPGTAIEKFEKGASVTVEDDLTLNFAIKYDSIPADSIAYITRGKTTTEIVLTDDYKEGEEGAYYYIIPCTGIAAKEMHDKVTVVIKSADGLTLSETKTDSVYDYAVRMLAAEQGNMSNAKYAALKTVLVDMLNYGTMAQVQFNHNTENLANKVLTPSDWANATTKMQETPAVTAKTEGGIKHLGTTFELNTNIAMLVAVEGNATSAKVYVDGEYVETVTATAGNGFSIFTFNGLNAADGRKEVKFEINGDASLTVTDSLAAYVGRNIEKYPYLANLMNYCDAAAAYFEATK